MSRTFGDRLRYYRVLAKMSQADLAAAAHTTRSSVNNYEHGFSEPSFSTLCEFAETLGVDPTDLVVGEKLDLENARRRLLSESEVALIDAYRAADPVYQGIAFELLNNHPRG